MAAINSVNPPVHRLVMRAGSRVDDYITLLPDFADYLAAMTNLEILPETMAE